MAYPSDRKYTKEHEWIKIEGTTGLVGITDYAQSSLGDIVFVDLPQVGAELQAGSGLGTVESVKAVSDIYSPVSGTVLEVNAELADAPEKINQEPHDAWLIKIELKNPAEVDALLSAEDYEKLLQEETH